MSLIITAFFLLLFGTLEAKSRTEIAGNFNRINNECVRSIFRLVSAQFKSFLNDPHARDFDIVNSALGVQESDRQFANFDVKFLST